VNATGATITSLTVVPMRLRFHEPFAVTSGVRTHLETVLVRLTFSDGTVGWGEASPDEGVTGESPTACVEALDGVLAEAVMGRGVDDVDALGSSIDDAADGAGPAARAAVAYDTGVQVQVRKATTGMVQMFKSGEGLVMDFSGPGRVVTQSRNPNGLINWIQSVLPGSRQ